MLAYCFADDDPVKQWVPAEGQEMPAEVEDAILDDRIIKYAWNKPFEWQIWKNTLGIETPHASWRDPMVMAMTCSLPGGLDKAGAVLDLPEDLLKLDGGKRLMRWFSMLRKATKTKPVHRVYWYERPADWLEYLDYNRRDVEAERAAYLRLRKYDLPQHEWDLWVEDQEINERGIPVNLGMAHNAIEARDALVGDRMEQMKEITGLENPNSGAQLLPWLRKNGYPFADLKKGHVRRALASLNDLESPLAVVLGLRLEVSRASTKKFDALAAHTDEDGRMRYCLQFAGAKRTWRWGGRVFQPQNLASPENYLSGLEVETTPKGFKRIVGGSQIMSAEHVEKLSAEALDLIYTNPMDVLSSAVRPVVQAPDGYVFIDADLNAIENRILGWMANDEKILSVFREGRDPYLDFGSKLFRIPYEVLLAEYKAGDKRKRTTSKPGVLGCGYRLAAGKEYEDHQTGEIEATGLLGYAWNMGVRLTPEESERSVSVWRDTYEDAVRYWAEIEAAAKRCILRKKETEAGPVRFDRKGPFMRMILPSERALHYVRPKVQEWLMPWGKYKKTITYEQENDRSQWDTVSTHSGKLTENGDQAIARDVLAHGMRLARKVGIPIVMHVHDQLVGLVKEDDAEKSLRHLIGCMEVVPEWAKGLPLAAEGHISKWFVKS